MSKAPIKNLIYLNSNQEILSCLQSIRGTKWNIFHDLKGLIQYLDGQRDESLLVVHTKFINLKAVQYFLSLKKKYLKISFIFIAQTIEKAAHQLSFANPDLFFFYESEGDQLGNLVTRCIYSKPVKSRKHERMCVESQVMLKKSVMAESSPVGGLVQVLRDGQMKDFSQGGALVAVKEAAIREKDFISLMYQNHHGKWVSVESQVRWVVSTMRGEQIIGVQFLAVSA